MRTYFYFCFRFILESLIKFVQVEYMNTKEDLEYKKEKNVQTEKVFNFYLKYYSIKINFNGKSVILYQIMNKSPPNAIT